MKHELGGQIMKMFVGLTCSYIKDKKEKENLHFEIIKAVQNHLNLEENHLEENKINADSLEDQKEFIKNNKLILKTQQRFKRERHNVFSEQINKIPLSSMMIKEYNQLIWQKHMHME